MPIALTCTCGARLEIDDKFAGQAIPCPDCNRLLTTAPPTDQPQRTSGFAIASLLTAIIGAFTLVGTLLAIGFGMLALKQIKKDPLQIAGRKLARSGIVLGVLLTLVSGYLYLAGDIFGIDGLFRDLEWSKKLSFPTELNVDNRITKGFAITRASESWGIYQHTHTAEYADDLILFHPGEDAQVAVIQIDRFDKPTPEEMVDIALSRFKSSELVTLLGRFKAKTPKLDPKVVSVTNKGKGDNDHVEVVVDLALGGVNRTFLMEVLRPQNRFKVQVLVGAARKGRYARLEPTLRKMLDSFQSE